MLLVTTDTLPEFLQIKNIYPMVEVIKTTLASEKSFIDKIFSKDRDAHTEAMEALEKSCPNGANAIIGIKVATTSQVFRNGTFHYTTYIGTPVYFEKKEG